MMRYRRTWHFIVVCSIKSGQHQRLPPETARPTGTLTSCRVSLGGFFYGMICFKCSRLRRRVPYWAFCDWREDCAAPRTFD